MAKRPWLLDGSGKTPSLAHSSDNCIVILSIDRFRKMLLSCRGRSQRKGIGSLLFGWPHRLRRGMNQNPTCLITSQCPFRNGLASFRLRHSCGLTDEQTKKAQPSIPGIGIIRLRLHLAGPNPARSGDQARRLALSVLWDLSECVRITLAGNGGSA